MSSKTFKLDLENDTLVIPQEVLEYLHQCQGKIDVSLTISTSETPTAIPNSSSDDGNKEFSKKWERWFDEVDKLEPSSGQSEPNEYGQALQEKYRKQGLDL